MTDLQQRLNDTLRALPDTVSLVAVSKFHPAEAIREAYEAGQRVFGESRAQELVGKHDTLPADIEWHFIGHLQPNKVKYIAPFVSLIHAVDTFRLLQEIDKQGRRCDRVIPCLLQLHVAAEETKFGFTPQECREMLDEGAWRDMDHVEIAGIMCMASNTDDEARIRADFREAYRFYREAKSTWFADSPAFTLRSWGMSGDWHIAVEEGSNMVRIGSAIFGERTY
ncbi:MAG: YggS family pyridoxal phosphate-dependent enzyme [Alloprevotella sp.]